MLTTQTKIHRLPIIAKKLVASNSSILSYTMALALLCIMYFAIEYYFNQYSMLAIDEFWFAHFTHRYLDALPYRDFAPYKTVLGYYILLLPLVVGDYLFSHHILPTLYFVRDSIALFNALLFFVAASSLSRYFSRSGMITSLILLILSDIVLTYSTNIRVDLLGYWLCFFALLSLMQQRFLLAGILLSIGFLITQKAIWYLFASDIALMMQWLFFSRQRKMILDIIVYHLTLFLIIAGYIIFWSFIADFETVIASMFKEAAILYQLNWYESARALFWGQILFYNPLLFGLWPLTLISLVITFENDKSYHERFFIVITGIVILLCLIPYKMIFPYYMQVTIPILLMVYAAFFTWLYQLLTSSEEKVHVFIPRFLWWLFLLAYLSLLILVVVGFDLPLIYLMIAIIPLSLSLIVTKQSSAQPNKRKFIAQLILITIIFTGGIYPLAQWSLKTAFFRGDYQKANVNVIHALLQDGSQYVAGIALSYNKTQAIAGLRQLIGPAIDYLTHPSSQLKRVMLPSLYQDPSVTSGSIIKAFEKIDVKFYVNNYRMAALPKNIKEYLHSHYEHLWGSIYFYSPLIPRGSQQIKLLFTGRYLIEAIPANSSAKKIIIGGKSYQTGNIITLKRGHYLSIANQQYRLKLIPHITRSLLNPQFQQEQLIKMV